MRGYVTIDEGCVAAPLPLRPMVSVIVPTYNCERFLNQALDSIQNQTLENIEVLVVNDGSTDGSLAIAQAHAAADGRIRVIDKPNGGYGSACNRGLAEARGTWIAIVEPDDWIEPDMYRAMVSFANGFSAPIDIVKTPYWRIIKPDTPQQRRLNCSYRHRINPSHQPFTVGAALHLLKHHPSVWSALYRADFLRRHNIRFREYPGAGWADNPFLVETLCQAHSIVYLDQAFYCYREETPQEYADFVRHQTCMPLERWLDMMDVLERLGIDDPGILRIQNSRGFTYINGIMGVLGELKGDARERSRAVFARMDKDLVMSDPHIAPANKQLYAELLGLPCPRLSRKGHWAVLAGEGIYNLANNGPGYAWEMLTDYLKS